MKIGVKRIQDQGKGIFQKVKKRNTKEWKMGRYKKTNLLSERRLQNFVLHSSQMWVCDQQGASLNYNTKVLAYACDLILLKLEHNHMISGTILALWS